MSRKIVVFAFFFLFSPLMAIESNISTFQGFRHHLSALNESLSNWNVLMAETFVPPKGFYIQSSQSSFRFEIEPFYRGLESEVRLLVKGKHGFKFEINYLTRRDEVSRYEQLLKSYSFLDDTMGFDLIPVVLQGQTNQVLCGSSNLIFLYPQSVTNDRKLSASFLIEVKFVGKPLKYRFFTNTAFLFLHSIDFTKVHDLLGESD